VVGRSRPLAIRASLSPPAPGARLLRSFVSIGVFAWRNRPGLRSFPRPKADSHVLCCPATRLPAPKCGPAASSRHRSFLFDPHGVTPADRLQFVLSDSSHQLSRVMNG